MTKIDPIIEVMIRQSVLLQQKFESLNSSLTPTWQKTLLALSPVIGAIIAGAISIIIARLSFIWINKRDERYRIINEAKEKKLKDENEAKEKKIKIENDLKDRNIITTRIYGQLFGLVYSYINEFGGMNYHNIEWHYYLNLVGLEKDAATVVEYKVQAKESRDNALLSRAKSVEILNKILNAIGEYQFNSTNNNVIEHYKKLKFEHYNFEIPTEFVNNSMKSFKELNDSRIKIHQDASKFLEDNVQFHLYNLVEEIEKEGKKQL